MSSQRNNKKLNFLGQLLLLAATIAWGTSFFILKETISEVPAFYVIAIRFLFSGAALSIVFIKKLKRLDKKTFLYGVILGVFLTAAYMTQTIGLIYTTPGRNAFLTSSYCVMCPFLIWAIFKLKPKLYNVISALTCIVGIGFIALSGDSGTGGNLLLGDGLTLVAAIFFGFQIIYIDKFQKNGADSVLILIFQFLTVGILFGLSSLIFELPTRGAQGYVLNTEQILKIGYLTVVCTLFAQSAQMIGQKFATANQSSIILSLESVFGMLFSVLVGAEKLSVGLGVGFAIVFCAIMIGELKLDPIKIFRKKNDKAFSSSAEINDNDDEKNDK